MHVDLLVSNKKFYTEEGYAAKNTSHSLQALGISHRIIDLSVGVREAFFGCTPTLSISFNHLTYQLCQSFCAVMNIPHVCWSEGILMPQNKIFPFGVEKINSASVKTREVITFANVTDQLVNSMTGFSVSIFGEHEGQDVLLSLPSGVSLHGALPYIEHFEILKQSKIVLLTATSQWYWPAVAAGCLPEENPEKIAYYLSHPKQKEDELNRLAQELPHRTWLNQVRKLMQRYYV